MRIRVKRIFITFLSIAIIMTGMVGNISVVKAESDPFYIADTKDLIVTPGQTSHISIPIQARSGNTSLQDISIVAKDGVDLFTFSKPNLTINGGKVNYIPQVSPVNLEFDVTVDDSASIKSYAFNIVIIYKDYSTYSTDPNPEATPQTYNLTYNLKVQEEKSPAQLTVSDASLLSVGTQTSTSLQFTVKNEGGVTARSANLTLDFGTVLEGNYTAKSISVGDLKPGDSKTFTLPVSVLSTASEGRNSLTANFTYKNSSGTGLTSSYKFYVNVTSSATTPNLIVTNITYGDSLKPGDNFTLTVALKNSGSSTASNIVADIDPTSITANGIIKAYYTKGVKGSNIAKGKSGTIQIPLKVSNYATGSMLGVLVNITYTDASGAKYTVSQTAFVDVVAAGTAGAPNLIISDVVQSPSKPQAGQNLNVSFTVENKSKVDITELKIYTDGLTGNTFIPVNSDPYIYIERLGGGKKKQITIPLLVSTGIADGLNNLTIKYTYSGSDGGSAVIPIHDVQNNVGSSSIPKLIVSKYTTDSTELKAGSTFNLSFDVYNTNANIAAKNITVTLTQADNIFTVTQGSNSFFINKMKPGETVSNTVQMKVKSDATTKAYPITLTIEYEYDGEQPNTETGEVGMKRTETLNLNAEENARPVVDSINVSSFDGQVMAGGSATLSFNFYNMGKAVLNNVTATVEGDGFTPTGGMLFIGNVDPGSSAYEEIEVTPNSEGTVSGTLKISYEDSNGETIDFTKDFQADVMPAANVDPGVPGGDPGQVINPDAPVVKAAIMPVWAFVILLLVIFAIFVPVTRKVAISIYKVRLRKKDQEQYDKEQL